MQASVSDLPTDQRPFDTIVMLGNNFGLLGNREAAPVILGQLAAVAHAGTRLIGSVMDPYATSKKEHRTYHAWNTERGRLPGQLSIRVRDELVATPWFDYLLLSERELAEVIDGSPWALHSIERGGANYALRLDTALTPSASYGVPVRFSRPGRIGQLNRHHAHTATLPHLLDHVIAGRLVQIPDPPHRMTTRKLFRKPGEGQQRAR